MNNKSVMLQIFTLRGKNKSVILHSFASKTKVSCYITFFQTILRPFSCDFWYSDRRIILSLYYEKRKVNDCLQEEQYIPYNEQQKVSSQIFTLKTEEKQKYHITFFARKIKLSYYITFFQTFLTTFSCGLCYSDRRIILSY